VKTAVRQRAVSVQTLQPFISSSTASRVTVSDLNNERPPEALDELITVDLMQQGISKVSVSHYTGWLR